MINFPGSEATDAPQEILEKKLARICGSSYAFVTGSGRSALEIGLASLEAAAGSILCSDFTCSIVPQTIISSGFRPVFVDIDRNLSTNLKSIGKVPDDCRALILNYLYGCPTDDLQEAQSFAKEHHLFLIEDAAQSFGARCGGTPVGSVGDLGIFSFAKIFFSLRRGGCITTSNKELAEKVYDNRALREGDPDRWFLLTRRAFDTLPAPVRKVTEQLQRKEGDPIKNSVPEYFYVEQSFPGQHWKLAAHEIDTCIKILDSLEERKKLRSHVVEPILREVREELFEVFSLPFSPDSGFVYSKIPLICQRQDRYAVKSRLQQSGLVIDMDYRSLHRNSALREHAIISGDYPVSDEYSHRLIPLPVHESVHGFLRQFLS